MRLVAANCHSGGPGRHISTSDGQEITEKDVKPDRQQTRVTRSRICGRSAERGHIIEEYYYENGERQDCKVISGRGRERARVRRRRGEEERWRDDA